MRSVSFLNFKYNVICKEKTINSSVLLFLTNHRTTNRVLSAMKPDKKKTDLFGSLPLSETNPQNTPQTFFSPDTIEDLTVLQEQATRTPQTLQERTKEDSMER